MSASKLVYEQLTEVTREIIGGAINVHKALGPGFTERIYAKALQLELKRRGLPFSIEQSIRVEYRNQLLGLHRLDLVVNDEIVVELKAVYEINNFHVAQVLSYLKASGKSVGLLLNFARGKLEIKRVVR
ncbi:MAG: GxxExxY protein [Candidatus Omnitrophota bacterium]|nr:GxxExxY protein [Candidatus Omnitrophota bacterium]